MKGEFFTAVVGDVMDSMGLTNQFLPPRIKPLDEEMVIIGRALTVLENDVDVLDDDPFGLMFDALDDLKKVRFTWHLGQLERTLSGEVS